MNDSQKDNILIILPSIPYPLRADGRSVRYLPLIKYLSKNHNVDLVIIHHTEFEKERIDGISEQCRKVITVNDRSSLKNGFIKKAFWYIYHLFPWTPPFLLIKHNSKLIVRDILKGVGNNKYKTLLWVTPNYSPYLDPVRKSVNPDRVVVDFIDSPALWAKRDQINFPKYSLLSKYEGWKMIRWEGKLIRNSSATIYISPVDASAVPEIIVKGYTRYVVNNGINIAEYNDSLMSEISHPNIGFLGNMGYEPNIEAVTWLYENVYVPLKKDIPELNLIIIGRNPQGVIRNLGNQKDVIVTGTVDDIWPYVNSIDIFVFPIWMGTGIKNKLLEAMFARKPVITTPVGNDGIGGESGKHLIVCHSENEFIKETKCLIKSEEKRRLLGSEGHEHVLVKFS